MLSMGDAVRRTQKGNNNAYCQNNELSWFDWTGEDSHRDETHFLRGIIAFTQELALFQEERLLPVLQFQLPRIKLEPEKQSEHHNEDEASTPPPLPPVDQVALKRLYLKATQQLPGPCVVWHGVQLVQPDWSYASHTLAMTLYQPIAGEILHLTFNSFWEPLPFELPPLNHGLSWHRIVDTYLPTPEDFCEVTLAPAIAGTHYYVQPRSMVVLMAK